MKKIDEELQQQIEGGTTPSDGMDANCYQKVFNALRQEPEYSLPLNFADKMMALIEVREKSKESSRDIFWICFGVFSFLMASVVAFISTGFKISAGAFRFLSGHFSLLIFGIVFITFLHLLDKKVIRRQTSINH